MINLNPSEIGSEWTFILSGYRYSFALTGKPNNRPPFLKCRKIIAENPQACAKFLHNFFAAFADVFLGWPMNAKKQASSESTTLLTNLNNVQLFK